MAKEKHPHDDYQEPFTHTAVVKTEHQNSSFYVFNHDHFTDCLNSLCINLNSFAPVLSQKGFYRK